MLSGRGKSVREENHYTFPANVFSISEDKEGRIWVTLADRFATLAADGKFTYRYAPGSISFRSGGYIAPDRVQ